MRTVYVNGQWVLETEAKVSVFDRGFLFADAVYEVTAVIDGQMIDFDRHVERLQRSLSSLEIAHPFSPEELRSLHHEIISRNQLQEGMVYLQVSRGEQDRDFVFAKNMRPTVVMFTQSKKIVDNPKAEVGIAVVTMAEGRWARRQIKTVQLLYSSLVKVEAQDKGAEDVLFVEDGLITEATSANAHIVTKEGSLVTRDLSNALLHGITRQAVLDIARTNAISVEERAFTPEEAINAAEVFTSSATSLIMPILSIDGQQIGTGAPGPVTVALRKAYIDAMRPSR